MPPWFAEVLKHCETLSLDNQHDRAALWEWVKHHIPSEAIEAAISDNIGHAHPDEDIDRVIARIKAAVINSFEEA